MEILFIDLEPQVRLFESPCLANPKSCMGIRTGWIVLHVRIMRTFHGGCQPPIELVLPKCWSKVIVVSLAFLQKAALNQLHAFCSHILLSNISRHSSI